MVQAIFHTNYKKKKKMKVSIESTKIIRELLSEQEPSKQAKGINYDDTGTLLSNVISGCQGVNFLKGRPIKAMTKTSPADSAGVALMYKFPDVIKSGKENVAFAAADAGAGNTVIVFGMQDPNIPENALLGYTLRNGAVADRIVGGIAKGCQYVQKIQDVGQAQLSAYDKAKLDDFMRIQGGLFTTTDPKDPLNYREYKMKDLKDADGRPLLQNPGEGIVWKKVGAGKAEMGNIADEIDDFMKIQGFTQKKPPIGSDEANYGFYLKDVQGDLPSLSIDPELRNKLIYFPDPNYISEYGGSVLTPDKKTCKMVIDRLSKCKNATNKAGCTKNLFRDKFIALSCGDKNYVEGPFGRGDEYREIAGDAGPYGLARLARARGQVKFQGMTENLDRKINRILNENFRNLSYNRPKVKFDKVVVETLADQLVLSAYFDLKRDLKTFGRLNESIAGDAISAVGDKVGGFVSGIGSALGSGLGDKLWQAGKETVAKKIIAYLGFDPQSYMALLLVNIFANLEVSEYGEFINNCEKFSAIITKSALEAWLDKAAQSMGTGDGGVTTFVYSALKNTVTETAANTTPFKRLEGLVGKVVCSIVEGIRDGISSGDISIF